MYEVGRERIEEFRDAEFSTRKSGRRMYARREEGGADLFKSYFPPSVLISLRSLCRGFAKVDGGF